MACPNNDEEMDSKIRVINNSSNDIVFVDRIDVYPDTMIRIQGDYIYQSIREDLKVKGNSQKEFKRNWRHSLEKDTEWECNLNSVWFIF